MLKRICVYRLYAWNDELLYVGISLSVLQRISQHKNKHWFDNVMYIKIKRYDTKAIAMAVEKRIIQQEKPKYNIVHQKLSTRNLLKNDAQIVVRYSSSLNKLTKKAAEKVEQTKAAWVRALIIKELAPEQKL